MVQRVYPDLTAEGGPVLRIRGSPSDWRPSAWPRRTAAVDRVTVPFPLRHRREGQRAARSRHGNRIECETTDRPALRQRFAHGRDPPDIACGPREGGER